MAFSVLLQPTELFNILNQETVYPCVSDPNYLFLIDARTDDEYDESHIETAKRSRTDDLGHFYLPYDAELECKTHVVVYDGNCKSTEEDCPAVTLAKLATESGSKNPVKILNGGYEDFSALYPFLRTQKIIYMPRDFDIFMTYPCEVIPGMLYIGNQEQACNETVLKNLKIKSQLHLSYLDPIFEEDSKTFKQIEIEDKSEDDFLSHADEIIKFISINRGNAKAILISSDKGISRSAAVCILYCMSYYSWNLEEAWNHVKGCKHNMRPNRGLVRDLAAYEKKLFEKSITDISDPFY